VREILEFGALPEERRSQGKIARVNQYLLDQAQDKDLQWFPLEVTIKRAGVGKET